MHRTADLALRLSGHTPGKLLADPDVWFPVNAQLAGIDPWSDSPIERTRYMVYQRKMSVDAASLRAQLQVAVDPSKAHDALTAYLDLALPEPVGVAEAKERSIERQLDEVANMAPIPLSSLRIGSVIGTEPPDVTDRPRRDIELPKTIGTGRKI